VKVVSSERKPKQDLATAIEKAVDFHGHLGPFLVIGVRMGIIGLQRLGARRGDAQLRVAVSVEPSVPFSCVIDGVQVTTRCTVGNGKLKLRDSPREISATFEVSGGKRVTVTLNPAELTELKRTLLKTATPEKLEETARVVASMPEKDLFMIQE